MPNSNNDSNIKSNNYYHLHDHLCSGEVKEECVLHGRVYYYCRLQNDVTPITIPPLSIPTTSTRSSNSSDSNIRNSSTVSGNNSRKRTMEKVKLPSSSSTFLQLNVPFVGWIFEITPSSSSSSSSLLQQQPNFYHNRRRRSSSSSSWEEDDTTSITNTTGNNKQYAILCVPQSYETIVWHACLHQTTLHVQQYTIVPIQQQHPPILLVPLSLSSPGPTTATANFNNGKNNWNDPLQINNQRSISSMIFIPLSSSKYCDARANVWLDHANWYNHSQQHRMNQPLQIDNSNNNKLCSSNNNTTDNPNGTDVDSIWTLEQLARYETCDAVDNNKNNLHHGTKKKKQRYTLIGRVTTVSPILSVQGKDPFVLVEMVHECNSTTITTTTTVVDNDDQEILLQFHCVVVIRKEGLLCQSSIIPKDTILCLRQVRKQQWKIPDFFEQQQQQQSSLHTTITTPPPSSVFVVDSPHQIEFIHTTSPSPNEPPATLNGRRYHHHHHQNNSSNHYQNNKHPPIATDTQLSPRQVLSSSSLVPPFTSLAAMTHIVGRLYKVHFHSPHIIHMFEIIVRPPPPPPTTTMISPLSSPHPTSTTIKLYVSQYPMSTSLALLLQLFARVNVLPRKIEDSTTTSTNCSRSTMELYLKVYNVQCLGYDGYGANLYTTVTVENIVCNINTTFTTTGTTPGSISVPLAPNPFQQHTKEPLYGSIDLCQLPIPYDINEGQQCSYEQTWIRDLIHTNIFDVTFFGPNVSVDLLGQSIQRLRNIVSHDNTHKLSSPVVRRRNVYIEFFTRPKYCCVSNESHEHITTLPVINLPYPISITAIRQCTLKAMREQLRRMVQTSPMSTVKNGWTGAKQYVGRSLYELFSDKIDGCCGVNHFDSEQQVMYTFGRRHCGTGNIQDRGVSFPPISISDGHATIPIVFLDTCTAAPPPSTLDGFSNKKDSDFVWVAIKGVVVSSICLGKIPNKTIWQDKECSVTLPPYDSAETGDSLTVTSSGACGMYVVNGYFFMVSVFIISDGYHPVGLENIVNGACCEDTSVISLAQCLNPDLWSEETNDASSVVSLLSRGKFKLGKVKSNGYCNYTMTLAHTSIDQSSDATSKVFTTIQCVDVKPPVGFDAFKCNELLLQINAMLKMNKPVSEETVTLGVVWWKLACCPSTCALLSGGWDQSVQRQKNCYGVIVHTPVRSIYRDSKRGYTRIRCDMKDVVTRIRWFEQFDNNASVSNSTPDDEWFDFIGGSDKFLSGILHRRPRRRQFGGVALGECLMYTGTAAANLNTIGIPRNRLSDLSVLLCRDLQSTAGQRHLAPSLTREIREAFFLGINYCRARAECSQCYESLYNPNDKSNHPITLPSNSDDNITVKISEQNETLLRCPNGCRVDRNGSIKWECSGTIDDGTGQAKLFAERDAAICLLGLSSTSVATIEGSIWGSNRADGYIYLRTTPPPSHIRNAVLQARAMAMQNIRQVVGKDVRQMNDADVIQYMSQSQYGEYLFHRHCRTSVEPLRSLIYYVRCKPLSVNGANTLNQTEIDIVTATTHLYNNSNTTTMEASTESKTGDNEVVIMVPTTTTPTQSYALPPIFLNLVDCCRPPSPPPVECPRSL